MPECYIRGSTIKYLRIPDEIIDMVKEEVVAKGRGRGGLQQQKQQKGRGMGGTGRGRPAIPSPGAGPQRVLGGLQHVVSTLLSVGILGHHGAKGLGSQPPSLELGAVTRSVPWSG